MNRDNSDRAEIQDIVPGLHNAEASNEHQPGAARLENHFFKLGAKLQDNGYRIVPIGPGVKYPQHCIIHGDGRAEWRNLVGWEQSNWKPELTDSWPECGIGIMTGDVVAIDIDLMDAELVNQVRNAAIERLGETPLERVGLPPKRIMLYRTDKPFMKMKMGKIEVLAQGQQFVAFGNHPDTGKPYSWVTGEAPDTVSLSSLPLVTQERVHSFLTYVNGAILPDKHRGNKLVQGTFNNPGRTIEGRRVVGTEHYIADAMRYIPNIDLHWDDWNRIGMNLYAASEGAEWGLAAFEEFTNRSGKAYQGKESAAKAWDRLRGSPPDRAGGAATIYAIALEHGWPHPPMWAHMYRDMPQCDEAAVQNMQQMGSRNPPPAPPQVWAQPVYQPPQQPAVSEAVNASVYDEEDDSDVGGPVEIDDEDQESDGQHSFTSSSFQDKVAALREKPSNNRVAVAAREEALKTKALLGKRQIELDKLLDELSSPTGAYPALAEMRAHIESISPTNATLATAAALVTLGSLVAPAYKVDNDGFSVRPHLFVFALAPSGSGKNAAVKFSAKFYNAAGIDGVAHGSVSSGPAIETALTATGSLMLAFDEFGSSMSDGKGTQMGVHTNTILTTITQAYTSSNLPYITKTYADKKRQAFIVDCPCVSVFAASTPTAAFNAIDPQRHVSGIGNRVLIIPSTQPSRSNKPSAPPTTLEELARKILDSIKRDAVKSRSCPFPQSGSGLAPNEFYRTYYLRGARPLTEDPHVPIVSSKAQPISLQLDGDAKQLLSTIAELQHKKATLDSNVLYGRLVETTLRLAGILQRARALLADGEDLIIKASDIQNAAQLAMLSAEALEASSSLFEETDLVGDIQNEQLHRLKEAGANGMERNRFSRIRVAKPGPRQTAEDLLERSGQIKIVPSSGKRGARVYLSKYAPGNACNQQLAA